MAHWNYQEEGIRLMIFVFGTVCIMMGMTAANIVLMGANVSKSLDDIEATFTPTVKRTGECGGLHVAKPLDACSLLKNEVAEATGSSFALIIRGGCTFDVKVRNAQDVGFQAAIVYDNEDGGSLVAMAGSSVGIHIPAVFVSKISGSVLQQYAGLTDIELWIIPTFENPTWSIMALSFISLLAMSAVLVTCFFVRRQQIRHQRHRAQNVHEFHGMSRRLVKAMPSLIFTSVLDDSCTSQTCAICLEDYNIGDKLRILPCRHKFHAFCVDSWLTLWRTFCPVCKRDARTSTSDLPASESTPLLSSAASTPFSSFHSSLQGSHAIQIVPSVPRLASSAQNNSRSSLQIPNSHRSFHNFPAICISRTSTDLRNPSSLTSQTSSVMSPQSSGVPFSSPVNSQYTSRHGPSSINASPEFLVASSSRYSYLRNSAASISPGYCIGSSSRFSYLRDCSDSGTPGYFGSSYLNSSSRNLHPRNYTESGSPSHVLGSSSTNAYLRHCSESRDSLSALSSGQSLPGC